MWRGFLKDHFRKFEEKIMEAAPVDGAELSVGSASVLGVIAIEDVFAAPRDLVGNAAFAQRMIGHFQAVQLEQLAQYAAETEGTSSPTSKSPPCCTSPAAPRNGD
jgi:hypothetical protein